MIARTDATAAAVHRARAERCYVDAEKFRRLGLGTAEADARRFARVEDSIAELLEGGRRA